MKKKNEIKRFKRICADIGTFGSSFILCILCKKIHYFLEREIAQLAKFTPADHDKSHLCLESAS